MKKSKIDLIIFFLDGRKKDILHKAKLTRRKRPIGKIGAKGVRRRRNSKRSSEVSGDVSDDSIGSASDLRAREEEEEEEKGDMGETETINDSVLTCGSSAYHAETESMALEESITKCPRVPEVPETEGDMLFVGHSYGEKPLLADDELDTEDDNQPASPPLLINIQDETPPKDVFALAPFQKPDSKRRPKKEINITPDSLLQLSTPSPPLLVAISPVVAEGSLVDLSDDSNEVSQDVKDSGFNTFSGDYDPSKKFPMFPLVTNDVIQDNTDLFGSSPFTKHSNNPFTDGSEIITTSDGLFHKTSIVVESGDARFSSMENSNQLFMYKSLPHVSNVFVSSTVPTSSMNQDLFGSLPFDSLPKNTESQSQYFAHRPTSLPVSGESLPSDVSNNLSLRVEELAIEPSVDTSSPEALMLPSEMDHNNIRLKKDKLHSLSEKCRYHLIEETRKSPAQAKHKIIKSSVSKKTGKISKKIGKIAIGGFSNMSFEDFPSDEKEETVDQSSSVPFEVLRDEKTPIEGERKFATLKSRTNPFS